MALLDSELAEIKAELGFNLLSVGAIPYVGVTSIFEQIIQANLSGGASTTSTTAVTAATSLTPVSLTLTSATGFSAGNRVVVDVNERQESSTVRSILGAVIVVDLQLTHSGTYPVTVEGPETIVRDRLRKIRAVKEELSSIFGEGALKRVDEIEFYDSGGQLFGTTSNGLMFWRDELAAAIGDVSLNLWRQRQSASSRMSVY